MPLNTILPSGTLALGSLVYSARVVSSHTMPDLIIASEKSKPAAAPALRPNMPCSVGPVRLGPSSSEWQVLHCWLKKRSPRAALPVWAKACVAERPTTIAAAAPAQLFITRLRTLRSMPLHVGRPRVDARGEPCVHVRAEPACAGHPSDNLRSSRPFSRFGDTARRPPTGWRHTPRQPHELHAAIRRGPRSRHRLLSYRPESRARRSRL